MNSRMEKYSSNSVSTGNTGSRASRNKKLYEDLYSDTTMIINQLESARLWNYYWYCYACKIENSSECKITKVILKYTLTIRWIFIYFSDILTIL